MAAQDQQDQENIAKNIAMCLSTGRCGTNLLALLLGLADDTCAVHEPVPGFHSLIENVQNDPEAALAFVRDVKLPAINAQPAHNYVETSHLFGKGFFEAFVELGVDFKLIILNRDPREVARSLRRVKAIPARSSKRGKYLLHPEQSGVMNLPGWQDMSDYQLCFWYCLEMERRKNAYAAICAEHGVDVVEIAMDDLLDFAKLRNLAEKLGLDMPESATEKHAEICATKINRKPRYLPTPTLVPLARQEEGVWRALGMEGGALYAKLCKRYGLLAETGPGERGDLILQGSPANG